MRNRANFDEVPKLCRVRIVGRLELVVAIKEGYGGRDFHPFQLAITCGSAYKKGTLCRSDKFPKNYNKRPSMNRMSAQAFFHIS